ncbi:hypothetical protein H9P43_005957 [Blastocladiella emersonii ATCC 22665]|nr:hypothetical protein H9P43_005957 [Blastocladiella emersonii ATCC 22665]
MPPRQLLSSGPADADLRRHWPRYDSAEPPSGPLYPPSSPASPPPSLHHHHHHDHTRAFPSRSEPASPHGHHHSDYLHQHHHRDHRDHRDRTRQLRRAKALTRPPLPQPLPPFQGLDPASPPPTPVDEGQPLDDFQWPPTLRRVQSDRTMAPAPHRQPPPSPLAVPPRSSSRPRSQPVIMDRYDAPIQRSKRPSAPSNAPHRPVSCIPIPRPSCATAGEHPPLPMPMPVPARRRSACDRHPQPSPSPQQLPPPDEASWHSSPSYISYYVEDANSDHSPSSSPSPPYQDSLDGLDDDGGILVDSGWTSLRASACHSFGLSGGGPDEYPLDTGTTTSPSLASSYSAGSPRDAAAWSRLREDLVAHLPPSAPVAATHLRPPRSRPASLASSLRSSTPATTDSRNPPCISAPPPIPPTSSSATTTRPTSVASVSTTTSAGARHRDSAVSFHSVHPLDCPDPDRARKARLHDAALRELMDTETAFVRDLDLLEELYVAPLEARIDVPSDLLVLLLAARRVRGFARALEAGLRAAWCAGAGDGDREDEGWARAPAADHVGRLFLTMMTAVYTSYCARSDLGLAAARLFEDMDAAMDRTRAALAAVTPNWNLACLLIKPVQRVLKYQLFLRQLADTCAAPSRPLADALVAMEKAGHALNTACAIASRAAESHCRARAPTVASSVGAAPPSEYAGSVWSAEGASVLEGKLGAGGGKSSLSLRLKALTLKASRALANVQFERA